MCFSFGWLANLLIWIIVVCAIVALIRLLATVIAQQFPQGATIINVVVQALWIIFWAIVCIAVVILVFDLIACLLPSVPRLR